MHSKLKGHSETKDKWHGEHFISEKINVDILSLIGPHSLGWCVPKKNTNIFILLSIKDEKWLVAELTVIILEELF